ncbi:MAG: transcription antitermination factor NusB [Clostridia bacterium]|nr:transcription antitermination factor NusB [Clostridia bacterium]
MDRTVARAHAMKLIYEWEMGGDGGEETRLNLLEVKPNEHDADYMNRMYEGVVANVEAIDGRLSPFLRGWTIERLTRVDLAILRLAVYELTLGENPAGVVINEAVELANQYSTDKAGAFVNGVLGNLARAMDEARANASARD